MVISCALGDYELWGASAPSDVNEWSVEIISVPLERKMSGVGWGVAVSGCGSSKSTLSSGDEEEFLTVNEEDGNKTLTTNHRRKRSINNLSKFGGVRVGNIAHEGSGGGVENGRETDIKEDDSFSGSGAEDDVGSGEGSGEDSDFSGSGAGAIVRVDGGSGEVDNFSGSGAGADVRADGGSDDGGNFGGGGVEVSVEVGESSGDGNNFGGVSARPTADADYVIKTIYNFDRIVGRGYVILADNAFPTSPHYYDEGGFSEEDNNFMIDRL